MSHHKRQCPDQILLFTRYPRPGKVKTRLIPVLGKNGAAQIHRELTGHALNTVHSLTCTGHYHLTVYFTGGTEQEMHDWLGEEISYRKQSGHTLGQKMAAAFLHTRTAGFCRAILIGSDCPAISAEILMTALEKLHKSDVVIGPTFDGGYYLIGINSSIPDAMLNSLFDSIPWGTSDVYAQTINRVKHAQLSLYTLPFHHDIDRPEDLEYFNYNPDPQ